MLHALVQLFPQNHEKFRYIFLKTKNEMDKTMHIDLFRNGSCHKVSYHMNPKYWIKIWTYFTKQTIYHMVTQK